MMIANLSPEDHDPEAFRQKLAYWREGRFPGVKYGHGGPKERRIFHDSTIKAEAKRAVEQAAANGIEAVPATRWV